MTTVDPRIERSRAAILAASAAILYEEGWEGLTQEKVAVRAGVGRSTVYRHWPARGVLLVDTINLVGLAMHSELSGDLRRDLIDELDRYRILISGPTVGGLLAALAHGARTDPDLEQAMNRTTAFHVTPARNAVEQAIHDGVLDSATNPDQAVAQLFGPITFCVLISGEPVSREFVEQIVDRFITVSQPTGAAPGHSRRRLGKERP
jgi:AcrR family transcriptional regulator